MALVPLLVLASMAVPVSQRQPALVAEPLSLGEQVWQSVPSPLAREVQPLERALKPTGAPIRPSVILVRFLEVVSQLSVVPIRLSAAPFPF